MPPSSDQSSATPATAPNRVSTALLLETAQRAGRYLDGLDDRPVYPHAAGLAGLAAFDEPPPAAPQDPAATLARLGDAGSPATVATAGGR